MSKHCPSCPLYTTVTPLTAQYSPSLHCTSKHHTTLDRHCSRKTNAPNWGQQNWGVRSEACALCLGKLVTLPPSSSRLLFKASQSSAIPEISQELLPQQRSTQGGSKGSTQGDYSFPFINFLVFKVWGVLWNKPHLGPHHPF